MDITEQPAQSSGNSVSVGQEASSQEQASVTETTSEEQAQVASPEPKSSETPDWQKQYEELQPEFTRKSQDFKELQEEVNAFDQYGGLKGLQQQIDFLQTNPRFQEFLKAEQDRDTYGFSSDEQDEDTRNALSLVEKVVDQRVSQELEKLKADQLNPLIEQNKEENIKNVFSQMDEKFPDWRELQEGMTELVQSLPEDIAENPSLDDVVGLYYRALAENPEKMSEFAAKQYEKKIESAKKKTIDKPGGTFQGSSGGASSISEAFNLAKTS